MIPKINVEEKIKELEMPWTPLELASVNDQVVRLALCLGEYHWHKHEKEDEFFYVYRGNLDIQVKDHPDISLKAGEMAVIPSGVEHRPKCTEPVYVLVFEPRALKSRGD
jgi:mannose-6-phosphate isomerase-like protein (cupin superfamily)